MTHRRNSKSLVPSEFDRLEGRILASRGLRRPPAHVLRVVPAPKPRFTPAPPRPVAPVRPAAVTRTPVFVAPVFVAPVFVAPTPPPTPTPPPPTPTPTPTPTQGPTALTAGTLTAGQFAAIFRAIPTAPAMTTNYQLAAGGGSGVIRSQVFLGTGAYAGLYAYAYQAGASAGRLDAIQFQFSGTPASASVVSGPAGALPDAGTSAPVPSLSFGSLSLTVAFGQGGVTAGRTGATVVVLCAAPPTQRIVSVVGTGALDLASSLPVVYAP